MVLRLSHKQTIADPLHTASSINRHQRWKREQQQKDIQPVISVLIQAPLQSTRSITTMQRIFC